ncbi:MAG: twin-arginine translocase subunit TatC [Flavobacteriales bacterium]|nr:twin-arginine translocase subunit TatC [Flavobacteriales bacterium]
MGDEGARSRGGKELTFLEHLEELRWTLVRSSVAIVGGMVLAFIAKDIVFDRIVLAPRDPGFITYVLLCRLSDALGLGDSLCFKDLGFDLQNITMSGQFLTHLKVSFFAGLLLASPYVFYELWRFVAPGLTDKERSSARTGGIFASLLFLLGNAFGYFVMAPMSIQFLGGYRVSDAVQNSISLDSYISTVTSIPLWTGIMFQLPLVVVLLARLGLLGASLLREYRRHAIVGIMVIAAIITPPDITSQLLVSGPLIMLYEASIILASRVERKRSAEVDGADSIQGR